MVYQQLRALDGGRAGDVVHASGCRSEGVLLDQLPGRVRAHVDTIVGTVSPELRPHLVDLRTVARPDHDDVVTQLGLLHRAVLQVSLVGEHRREEPIRP